MEVVPAKAELFSRHGCCGLEVIQEVIHMDSQKVRQIDSQEFSEFNFRGF